MDLKCPPKGSCDGDLPQGGIAEREWNFWDLGLNGRPRDMPLKEAVGPHTLHLFAPWLMVFAVPQGPATIQDTKREEANQSPPSTAKPQADISLPLIQLEV